MGNAASTTHCSTTMTPNATTDAGTDLVASAFDTPSRPTDAGIDVLAPAPDASQCDAVFSEGFSGRCESFSVAYPCGLPPGLSEGVEYGGEVCERVCGRRLENIGRCYISRNPATGVRVIGCLDYCPVDGRRPEGYALPATDVSDPVGRFLAASAALESASVTAFERLAGELAEHGAPDALVAEAERSAGDERRHTRAVRELARRYGAEPSDERPAVGPVRALAAVGVENAVEGCVRETWGALLAWWQATHASDPAVARAYRAIADDETRHAQLAWDVDDWLRPRLDEAEREGVDRARSAAFDALRDEAARATDPSLQFTLGLPGRDDAERMIGLLCARLRNA